MGLTGPNAQQITRWLVWYAFSGDDAPLLAGIEISDTVCSTTWCPQTIMDFVRVPSANTVCKPNLISYQSLCGVWTVDCTIIREQNAWLYQAAYLVIEDVPELEPTNCATMIKGVVFNNVLLNR